MAAADSTVNDRRDGPDPDAAGGGEPRVPAGPRGAACRRPDRGRGAVRDRGGVAAPGAVPGEVLRHPRGSRGPGRHMGPLPLPRDPLGLRHVHLRVPVPGVARAAGPGRRTQHPRLPGRHRRGGRDRSAHPVPDAGSGRLLVLGAGALDGVGAGRAGRDPGDLHVRLPVDLLRLLRLRAPAPPGVPRGVRLRGHDRAPAAVAPGPRMGWQARGRGRQRSHGGHARPRARRRGPGR